MHSKTYIPKQSEVQKKWLLVDAKDQILGRLATRVACLLIGKGKVLYTPHLDCGDHVVVVNAGQIRISGNKAKTKLYSHYTGYPGGLRQQSYETLAAKKPEEIVIRAVERMLPKNKLGTKMIKQLHVYSGEAHKQQAQKPVKVD